MNRCRFLFGCLLLTLCSTLLSAANLPLVPYPRQVTSQSGTLTLGPRTVIAVASGQADDRFAAQTLSQELSAIDNVDASVVNGQRGSVVLLRDSSAEAQHLLRAAGVSFPQQANEEGYVLLVNGRQATVIGHSAAGVFYGVQTLRQLFHPNGKAGAVAPAVRIVDWPASRWRGVHIDISRGPVPTLTSIKHDLALLAAYKINAYMIYFENTFAYQKLPLVSARGGAINAAEAKEIEDFARPLHITVIPEQETIGHMHLAMQYERFQNMVESPYGHVLSPTVPASLTFIGDMFKELEPAFPDSPFLHIGADETAELGQGRTAPLCQQEGGCGQVYINYLKAIDKELQPYHKKVMFWGDIAVHHPELLSQLPHDMIAIPWVYSPHKSFDRFIKPFTDAGLETWVAPGVNNWSRIYPNDNLALPNIRQFIADGRRLGATGVLNTTWMDDGESMVNYAWYQLVYGAAASWQPTIDDTQFGDAWDWAFYRGDGHNFQQDEADFTKIHQLMQQAVHTDGEDRTTWMNPFTPRGEKFYDQLEPQAHQIRLLAEDVMADLITNHDAARQNSDLLDWMDFSARRFDFLGQKAIYQKYIRSLYATAQQNLSQPEKVYGTMYRINGVNGLLQDMRDHVSALRGTYRELWLRENRPYFLGNILVRYDQELNFWQTESRRFDQYMNDYRTNKTLPSMDLPEMPASGTAY